MDLTKNVPKQGIRKYLMSLSVNSPYFTKHSNLCVWQLSQVKVFQNSPYLTQIETLHQVQFLN